MKKAAIKVPGGMFQEMLKLPFGVAIEDVIFDKGEKEFTVIVFGEMMDDGAEMTDDGKIRIATYEVFPAWHKGRITVTDETIKWPMDSGDKKEEKRELPQEEKIKESPKEVEEEKEAEEKEDENKKSESKGARSRRKTTRKQKE